MDANLEKICAAVSAQFQMGGLSSGIYGDYIEVVANRYAGLAFQEGYLKGLEIAYSEAADLLKAVIEDGKVNDLIWNQIQAALKKWGDA